MIYLKDIFFSKSPVLFFEKFIWLPRTNSKNGISKHRVGRTPGRAHSRYILYQKGINFIPSFFVHQNSIYQYQFKLDISFYRYRYNFLRYVLYNLKEITKF